MRVCVVGIGLLTCSVASCASAQVFDDQTLLHGEGVGSISTSSELDSFVSCIHGSTFENWARSNAAFGHEYNPLDGSVESASFDATRNLRDIIVTFEPVIEVRGSGVFTWSAGQQQAALWTMPPIDGDLFSQPSVMVIHSLGGGFGGPQDSPDVSEPSDRPGPRFGSPTEGMPEGPAIGPELPAIGPHMPSVDGSARPTVTGNYGDSENMGLGNR